MVSAFVAHFLGDSFSSEAARKEEEGLDRFGMVLDMMDLLPSSVPLALPLLPCGTVTGELKVEALEVLSRWADRAAGRGRRLALEIVPGSVAGSYTAFLTDPFWRDLAVKTGLLLDTGHAHVMGEDLPELLSVLAGRLSALHLSDNDGRENRSDAPGEGVVDWRLFLDALTAIGFEGSLDLEIGGSPDLIREQYGKGRAYLLNLPEGSKLKQDKRNEIAV
jgi:sugar phosphate isomerase/epimerase